jgi:hypothetical protein
MNGNNSSDHFPNSCVLSSLPLAFLNKDGTCPPVHHGCEDNPCPAGSECVADPREEKYSCVCPGGGFGKCPGKHSQEFQETTLGSALITFIIRERIMCRLYRGKGSDGQRAGPH